MIRLLLPLAVFLSASAALAVEIVIVRLGAPYVGQSLLPWSAAIVAVLLGLTAGHVLGGVAGGVAAGVAVLRAWLAAAWLAAGLVTMALPLLAGVVAGALADEHGFGAGAVVALAALACPSSLAAGFVAPLALRIAAALPRLQLPRAIGAIYAASALGSVIGTAASGFILLESIGAAGLASAAGGLWLLLGLVALPARRAAIVAPVYGAVLAAVGILPALQSGPCLLETRYTCVRLLDKPLPQANLLRFMILDEGVHSASDRDHPERLHLGYAALTDRLAQSVFAGVAQPQALVIGGGGATLPRAWANAAPPVTTAVIELDGEVALIARDQMWAGRSAALSTLVGDGRAVLRSMPRRQTYDVVLMDAYRTRSVPPHLVTAEFAREVAVRLMPNAVYLSNIIDRADPPLLALSIAATLKTAFPAVDLWLADEPRSGTTNVVVAAWTRPEQALRPATITVAATVMADGHAPRTENIVWRRLDLATAGRRWPQACAVILTDDRAPIDRLLAGRPVCRPASS